MKNKYQRGGAKGCPSPLHGCHKHRLSSKSCPNVFGCLLCTYGFKAKSRENESYFRNRDNDLVSCTWDKVEGVSRGTGDALRGFIQACCLGDNSWSSMFINYKYYNEKVHVKSIRYS